MQINPSAVAPGSGVVLIDDSRKLEVGSQCPDPGPGYWDKNLDLRTEAPPPGAFAAYGGEVFQLRNHAPSSCPSGPCGQRVVAVRLDPPRPIEHTAHSLRRCAEREVDPERALRIARESEPAARTRKGFAYRENGKKIELVVGREGIATVTVS